MGSRCQVSSYTTEAARLKGELRKAKERRDDLDEDGKINGSIEFQSFIFKEHSIVERFLNFKY